MKVVGRYTTRTMTNRNDPCWCGSGKKYKRCHLQRDEKQGGRPAPAPAGKWAKTADEIVGMRRAGAFNGELLDYIRPFVRAGVATGAIDDRVREYTARFGHTAACLGYHGFPKSCCISINNVVCHGIPSESEYLRAGDIVNVDLTTIVNGFHGDSSETFMIGAVPDQARRLVEVTARALLRGIAAVKPGLTLGAVADAIQPYVESQGCSVVQQYTGHGIGRSFHEGFTVYHHHEAESSKIIMEPGMTFTIEPMINLGDYRVVTDRFDKWTVRTKDNSLSAQFEHTVLVTAAGCEVLTLTPSQKAAGTILNVEGIALA